MHVLIFVITLVFSIGDKNLWWDYIFGRSNVIQSIDILTNDEGHGLSKTKNPKAFKALVKIAENHNQNIPYYFSLDNEFVMRQSTYIYLYLPKPSRIYLPSTITFTSGISGSYVLDNTPVLFEYSILHKNTDQNGDSYEFSTQAVYVGNVRDVKNWVEDSRQSNRFLVLTVFVGILSFLSSL